MNTAARVVIPGIVAIAVVGAVIYSAIIVTTSQQAEVYQESAPRFAPVEIRDNGQSVRVTGRQPRPPSPSAKKVLPTSAPAKVGLYYPKVMSIGDSYEVKLVLQRTANAPIGFGEYGGASLERMTVTNSRVTASVTTAFFKVQELSAPWQDISTSSQAVWLWRIEPLKAGKAQLIFNLRHMANIDGSTVESNAENFPVDVEMAVQWWQHGKAILAGLSPSLDALSKVAAAVITLSGLGVPVYAFWRKRQRASRIAKRQQQSPQGAPPDARQNDLG